MVQEVTFQIQVPFDTTGIYWGMIFVQGSPRPQERGGTTVLSIKRFGVKVYVTALGTELRSRRITRVRNISNDPLMFNVSFENTENIQLRPTGKIDIIDQFGEAVRTITIEEFPLLPEKVRHLTVVDPADSPLASGVYRAL
ncbi:hypothetical protein M1N79_02095, partial [Dehalococcoidia bacterium]|nr:hypothetical protein [Dehalococcoidia bacterium]